MLLSAALSLVLFVLLLVCSRPAPSPLQMHLSLGTIAVFGHKVSYEHLLL